jgi:Derlin-2/3
MDIINDGAAQLNNAQLPLEQWFYELPLLTRLWTTSTVITSVLTYTHILNPYQLFYTFRSVYHKSQYYRLLTTFIYFGPPSLDLVFHIFFMQRYSSLPVPAPRFSLGCCCTL